MNLIQIDIPYSDTSVKSFPLRLISATGEASKPASKITGFPSIQKGSIEGGRGGGILTGSIGGLAGSL
jgi:hypothetical protein